MNEYLNLTLENIEEEHICCAIADKKHQNGVRIKKEWLKTQIENGHIFRKLNQNGKVFIEYGDLEKEYVPIVGENYTYIYCFWVSGSFKENGHGKNLLEYAINDAKQKGKNGICVVVGKKKIPFLSDKKYLEKYGFKVVSKLSIAWLCLSDGKFISAYKFFKLCHPETIYSRESIWFFINNAAEKVPLYPV